MIIDDILTIYLTIIAYMLIGFLVSVSFALFDKMTLRKSESPKNFHAVYNAVFVVLWPLFVPFAPIVYAFRYARKLFESMGED